MAQNLRMFFETSDTPPKKVILTVPNCADGLTGVEVNAAMDTIIGVNIFTFELAQSMGAEIVETTKTELF